MKKLFMLFALVVSFSQTSSAAEVKDYQAFTPNIKNVSNTWMKYADEVLLSDRNLLDSYIALHYCQEQSGLFTDEVAREDFRKLLAKDILSKQDTYPTVYRMVKPVVIKEYDFDNNKIIITKKHSLDNITHINLPTKESFNRCSAYKDTRMNKNYIVDLEGRLVIQEIDLDIAGARKFLPIMHRNSNGDLVFYIIVDLKITGVLANSPRQVLFMGEVLDVGYYAALGEENRFGGYNFKEENKKTKIDYHKDLQFTPDPDKATY
jgi:hypothetical protein